MVLLIGNYSLDRQQSMQRFNAMMLQGLRECGVEAELVQPPAVLGRIRAFGATAAKWFGYIDKFILFRWRLWGKLAARPALVHICDHSNATYARLARKFPLVITCHDLLAVRGGLGEDTDCPASFTGRILQRWILGGLRRANHIACVSRATARDAASASGTFWSGESAENDCCVLRVCCVCAMWLSCDGAKGCNREYTVGGKRRKWQALQTGFA